MKSSASPSRAQGGGGGGGARPQATTHRVESRRGDEERLVWTFASALKMALAHGSPRTRGGRGTAERTHGNVLS